MRWDEMVDKRQFLTRQTDKYIHPHRQWAHSKYNLPLTHRHTHVTSGCLSLSVCLYVRPSVGAVLEHAACVFLEGVAPPSFPDVSNVYPLNTRRLEGLSSGELRYSQINICIYICTIVLEHVRNPAYSTTCLPSICETFRPTWISFPVIYIYIYIQIYKIP